MNPVDSRLRMAYTSYLQNRRLSQPTRRGELSVLVAEMMAVCAEYPSVSTSLHVFANSRSRLDARSATIVGIATLLETEFPADMDALLLDFLIQKSGLDDHPNRGRIAALAEKVGRASDWGTQIYLFSRGVLTLQREIEGGDDEEGD